MYTKKDIEHLLDLARNNNHYPDVQRGYERLNWFNNHSDTLTGGSVEDEFEFAATGLKNALTARGININYDYGPKDSAEVELEVGTHVGEMHGHEPSRPDSPLNRYGFKAGPANQISNDIASALSTELGADHLIYRGNKEAIVISSSYNHALLFYSYDHKFYLTPVWRNK